MKSTNTANVTTEQPSLAVVETNKSDPAPKSSLSAEQPKELLLSPISQITFEVVAELRDKIVSSIEDIVGGSGLVVGRVFAENTSNELDLHIDLSLANNLLHDRYTRLYLSKGLSLGLQPQWLGLRFIQDNKFFTVLGLVESRNEMRLKIKGPECTMMARIGPKLLRVLEEAEREHNTFKEAADFI